ncbi:hypothetical protein MBOL_26540 [Mycobacteroides abscessus subsp. bolletii BD]|nr:hypothetical protein MBOL_26540 [Mycobacteroides abscessus subsp. bolletii BD]
MAEDRTRCSSRTWLITLHRCRRYRDTLTPCPRLSLPLFAQAARRPHVLSQSNGLPGAPSSRSLWCWCAWCRDWP